MLLWVLNLDFSGSEQEQTNPWEEQSDVATIWANQADNSGLWTIQPDE